MKEKIKKITETRGYKIAEGIALAPVAVLVLAITYGFVLPMVLIGGRIEKAAERLRKED